MADIRLEIDAGAGGAESQAWAAMLLRMYLRWAARHGYEVAPGRDICRSDVGISSASLEMSGGGADALLTENGVHRLVRVSPFDSQNRRHTSFASVEVNVIEAGHIVSPHACRRGHQIRSYVLSPYNKAKDLRTAIERGDIDAVLDGDIDDFLSAAAEWSKSVDDRDGAAVMDMAIA